MTDVARFSTYRTLDTINNTIATLHINARGKNVTVNHNLLLHKFIHWRWVSYFTKMALFRILTLIYVLKRTTNSEETSKSSFPLDSGPLSFQTLVPESRSSLPELTVYPLETRSLADLGNFEAVLASLPGRVLETFETMAQVTLGHFKSL